MTASSGNGTAGTTFTITLPVAGLTARTTRSSLLVQSPDAIQLDEQSQSHPVGNPSASVAPLIISSPQSSVRTNIGYESSERSVYGDGPLLNLNVLVVDDVPMNRRVLKLTLDKRTGRRAVEAENGEIAVEKVMAALEEGEPFQLITMDYMMPVMDGPAACRNIRAAGYRGLIIGVTGNALPEDMDVFLAAGADRVLLKPVSASQLEDAVKGSLLIIVVVDLVIPALTC